MPAVAYVREDSISKSGTMLYVEGDGYVSFNAESPSRRSGDWTLVPNLGRTGSALTARSVTPATWVEYDVEFASTGEPKLQVVLSPTLNYAGNGHKLAVSIDGGAEHEIDVHGLYGGGSDGFGGGQKSLSLNAGMGEGSHKRSARREHLAQVGWRKRHHSRPEARGCLGRKAHDTHTPCG